VSWAKEVQLKPDKLSKLLLAKEEYGYTVLHVAIRSGRLETSQTLVVWAKEAQLQPDELCKFLLAKDKDVETLMPAGGESRNLEVIKADTRGISRWGP
jgi:hypothetical protein